MPRYNSVAARMTFGIGARLRGFHQSGAWPFTRSCWPNRSRSHEDSLLLRA